MMWVSLIGMVSLLILRRWLQRRWQHRRWQESIERELPLATDRLVTMIEAGVDIMSAIYTISESRISPLMNGFQSVVVRLRSGSSRSEALHGLVEDLPISMIRQWSLLLIQSDQLGTPLSEALRALADTMRESRMARLEEIGMAMSQKIIIPLVLFILPGSLLMMVGPVIIRLMTGDVWQ